MDLDTVIYQRGNSFYTKSAAVIEILNEIGGIWKIFGVFKLFPASFLDLMYTFIANHRYNWFGRKNECMIPSAEIKSRFLA
jgi:predicted DCC family thiol-disulfide oxidoreductase YuxK